MKTILILIGLFASINIIAQTQMNTTTTLQPEYTYYKYTGNASDTVKRLADSVYVEIINQLGNEWNCNVGVTVDTVQGADTSLVVNIWGKNFSGESYTLLSQTTSSANISAAAIVSAAYATAAPYRYVKVSARLKGAALASGVKINAVEVKLWKQ